MHSTERSLDRPLDLLTLCSIAIVAYALANVAHEGLAHGGVCAIAGGEPRTLNAIYFECDKTAMSGAAARWMAAAGSLVNLALGGIAWALLERRGGDRRRGSASYFLWLFGTINLLQATGYWLFSGLGAFGDWWTVVRGLEPAAFWRSGLALAGGFGYWAVVVLSLRRLGGLLGGASDRLGRALRLTVVPYLVGGALYVAAGLLNPESPILVLVSAAAASLGGTSALAWMAQLLRDERRHPPGAGAGLELERSRGWWLTAAATALLFVGLLGPGLRL